MLQCPGFEDALRAAAFALESPMLKHPNNNQTLLRVNFHIRGMSTAVPKPIGPHRKSKPITVWYCRRRLTGGQFLEGLLAEVSTPGEFVAIHEGFKERSNWGRTGWNGQRKQAAQSHKQKR